MNIDAPATLRPVPDPTPSKYPSPLYAQAMDLGLNPTVLRRMTGLSRTTIYEVFKETEGTEESAGKIAEAIAFARENPGDIDSQPGAVMQADDGSIIEFEVNVDAIGVRVVVRGPIENAEQLEQQAAKLIRDMRTGRDDGPEGS